MNQEKLASALKYFKDGKWSAAADAFWDIKDKITPDMLKRNPSKKFARLVGLNDSNGYGENGPDMNGIINYGTENQMKRFTFNVKDL